MSIIYVGLDFETTGVDLDTLRPIQIGVYVQGEPGPFGGLIYTEDTLRHWSVEAQAIHHITPERVATAPDVRTVDGLVWGLLRKHAKAGILVAVGYNIGNFDMEILRRWMPRTWGLFGYRVLDLNALPFLVAQKSTSSFDLIKESLNQRSIVRAKEKLGIDLVQHDAESDAVEAIMAMELQQEWVLDE